MARRAKKKSLLVPILLALLLIAVLGTGAVLGLNLINKKEDRAQKYSTNVIASQITRVSELTTLKYRYRNAAKLQESRQAFGLNIPLTDKNMIARYEGIIRIGTDLSKAEINLTEEEDGTHIRVALLSCEIQSHEIDEDSWELLSASSSVFNALTPDDDAKLRKEQKAEMEQSVREAGIIEEANDSARTQIETMLLMLYPDAAIEVTIS